MTIWARLRDAQIITIAECSRVPIGEWVDVTHLWPGWHARPSPGLQPFLIDNGIEWREARSVDQAWADARKLRNKLLTDSDWVTTRAKDWEQPVPAQWASYRQALRDITEQPDPYNISWPTLPE
jgi:Phage tail assembly chaperone protein